MVRLKRPARQEAVPAPAPAPAEPTAPAGARNLVFVVLDSLRYDSWLAAEPATLARLGAVQRRWSYASWTAPSHYNLLMGLLPHSSPPEVYASEYYKQDFLRYSERLGVPGMEFAKLLPSIFLPTYLKRQLGYRTHAMVSMPVLNRHTVINRDFDTYELMPTHNDMAAMLGQMEFADERPAFYLLNVGETHYPYALPDEDSSQWPRISGVHGVFKHLGRVGDGGEPGPGPGPGEPAAIEPAPTEPREFFDQQALSELRARQIRAVEYLDGVFARLFDLLPSNTWVIVTSDHGELFGEDRFFGHGPIAHEKVFEVPFVEGIVP
jgi:Sulfatase